MARRVRDQAAKRRSVQMKDQHGRTWHFTIDTDTMAPVGTGSAVDWTPPELPNGRRVRPPDRVLQFDPEQLGKVVIDYEAWIATAERADDEWTANLASFAASMYGEKSGEAIEKPTRELLAAVGPRPFPVAVIEAARDGDPWALGIPAGKGKKAHQPPAELEPVLASLVSPRQARGRKPAEATT